MKNKKLLGITAALAVTVLTGGSLAIFAAEMANPNVEVGEIESELATLIAEETEAGLAVSDAEIVETEPETAVPVAEETEAGLAVSDAEIVETEPETAAPVVEESEAVTEVADAEADNADYSYHVGQQSSTARNDAYEALPEGGTKEEAEEFYETYDIGGGAWVDGAYDESLKSGYGYAEGQQRMAQYAQDGDDDEEYKAGYSYSVGRQNYMDNYPNYTK